MQNGVLAEASYPTAPFLSVSRATCGDYVTDSYAQRIEFLQEADVVHSQRGDAQCRLGLWRQLLADREAVTAHADPDAGVDEVARWLRQRVAREHALHNERVSADNTSFSDMNAIIVNEYAGVHSCSSSRT